MAELGLDDEYLGPVGGVFQDLRHLLQGCSTGGAIIWIGDVGDDHPDRPNPGGFPPQVGTPTDSDATIDKNRGEMLVSTVVIGNVDRGIVGGLDINTPISKYYIPIHHDSTDIGAVSGDGAETGIICDQEMVGAGRIKLRGSEGGGEGGRGRGTDGRVGRWIQ